GAATVAGPVVTGRSVAFASAAGPVVRATAFDGRAARATEFPRGEQPSGRPAVTPSLSLTTEVDGALTVAAHWGGAFGTRRLHQRDTRESPELGPLRRDRFDAPALAVLGDALVALHERRVGTFTDDSTAGTRLEAAAFPAGPFDVATARDVVLSTSAGARDARLAAAEASAVALWRDGDRLLAARLDATPTQLSAVAPPLAWSAAGGAHHDVAAAGACAVAAWDHDGSIVARGIDLRGAGAVAASEVAVRPRGAVDDLRLARVGDGFVAMAVTTGSLQAWRVTLDAACAPTLSPLAWPGPVAPRPGLRLIAVSGDATGATVLSTLDPVDAPATLVSRVDLDAAFVIGPAVSERVPQPVVAGTRQDARIALVAGPYRGTVRVQRLGDAADDDEPGEDVLLRLARGARVGLVASARLHRIWVADRSDADSNTFHAPHSLVLHSVIDTLEDGPRTELATAAPPAAGFSSVSLHRIDPADAGRPAWALLASPAPAADTPPALEGAWVFLFDGSDRPVARRVTDGSPWPHAAALLPAALRTSHDRVMAVAWRGTSLAAIVTGPRAGVRLVTGDPFTETLRDVPLATTAPTMVRGATVLPSREGWMTFWLDVTHPAPTLHDRRFDPRGGALGAADRLGEFLRLDEQALSSALAAAVTAPGEFAVAIPTPHGVRVAEVRCSR
ncbi:MAG: hypothetical protein Q8S73_37625, partial [Deltaproteobacteria bacterium]|nr:hypothetical protein [Deltaproteobacteria bacterium]